MPAKEISMSPVASPQPQLSARQVSTAAENLAAAQFSLYGFDVLENSGRARFVYDLGVAKSGGMIKVMVHGSLDGFWDLVEPYLDRVPATKADYHRAIALWLDQRGRGVVCCLVKFESHDLCRSPRIYLASAAEIAEKLLDIVENVGVPALCEEYQVVDACGSRRVESLPEKWRFSETRIADLMRSLEEEKPLRFLFSPVAKRAEYTAAQPAARLNFGPMMN
jgi:hypothetical protein